MIFNAYKQRLGTASNPVMGFDLASLIQPIAWLEELSAPFTREEIDGVVKSMLNGKAPGPGGFNGHFLKFC